MLKLEDSGRITREGLLQLLSHLLRRHLRSVQARHLLIVQGALHMLLVSHLKWNRSDRVLHAGRANLAVLLALITTALRVA